MPRRPFPFRPFALAALAAAAAASSPQTARAQFAVYDPVNFGTRVLEYAMQGLQHIEQIASAASLAEQVTQLDDQIEHLRDAASGRVAALAQAFAQLSSDPAALLTDGGVGWAGGLAGDAPALVQALLQMDGSSLVDHLQDELDAADAIGEADLLNLNPSDPERGTRLAEAWREGREAGDRRRAVDFTAAEAGGRLATLLDNAQDDIAGIRAQGELSHTALQQAQVANQLTAAEIDFAVAQLLLVQAQQDALARHAAELLLRQRLEAWIQRERDAQAHHRAVRAAETGRIAAYRPLLLLPSRHGN